MTCEIEGCNNPVKKGKRCDACKKRIALELGIGKKPKDVIRKEK